MSTATREADVVEVARSVAAPPKLAGLLKTPTGISGLDEVTGGGLPRGRPTLVCGPAGCGKTLIAMEFMVRGIIEFDGPGVRGVQERCRPAFERCLLGFDLALRATAIM